MFGALSLFLLMALAMMALTREPPTTDGRNDTRSLRRDVKNMCRLWQDPRIWLLGFAPLSLGLANAWKMVAFTRVATKNLGLSAVAYLLLMQSLGQIVLAKPLGYLLPKTGAGVWVSLSALNYLLMPTVYLTASSLIEGWGILTWYVMMGLAWCIYDVVARTVVLEHFPSEQSGYAFATMNVQMFSTQALMFFLGAKRSPEELAVVLLVVSTCVLPGYLLAEYLKKRRESDSEEDHSAK